MQLRHIGIVTQNIESSLAFYCDLLGGFVSRKMEESGSFISMVLGRKSVEVTTIKLNLPEGEAQIELLSFLNPRSQGEAVDLFSNGLTHFALTVNSLDNLHKKMIQRNVPFITEPQLSKDGFAKVCFCRDPNGVYIELVELVNAKK
jgi:catechol 2,3-dioxygenase-like lactoylglutathione lyase family enzyme